MAIQPQGGKRVLDVRRHAARDTQKSSAAALVLVSAHKRQCNGEYRTRVELRTSAGFPRKRRRWIPSPPKPCLRPGMTEGTHCMCVHHRPLAVTEALRPLQALLESRRRQQHMVQGQDIRHRQKHKQPARLRAEQGHAAP